MAAYSVVFWNNTSAVIPDNWIDYNTKSFRWPQSKNPVSQIVKALPPNDNFYTFPYERVVSCFDSYDRARNYEIDSQNISINDDEGFVSLQQRKTQNLTERNARIIHKPTRYCTTSSDEDAKKNKTICRKRRRIRCLSSSEEDEDIDLNINLLPAPKNYSSKEERELPKMVERSSLSADIENRNHESSLHFSKDSRQASNNNLSENLKENAQHSLEGDLSENSDSDKINNYEKESRFYDFTNDRNAGSVLDDHSGSDNDKASNNYYRSTKPTIKSVVTMDTKVMIKKVKPSQLNKKIYNTIQSSCVERAVDLEANKSQLNSGRHHLKQKNGNDKRKEDGIHSKSQFPMASTCLDNSDMILIDESEHGFARQQSIPLSCQSTLESDINPPCHGHECCRKLFTELTGLKKIVYATYMMMLEKNHAVDKQQENKIHLDLHIKSHKQLSVFENKLQDSVVAAQYKIMVKRIGGKTYDKHIRNALNLTLSDELAYRMSWTGAKGTIMVKNMRLMEIIRDCIKDEWSSTTDNLIETVIKSWLQHSGDRLRSKNNTNTLKY